MAERVYNRKVYNPYNVDKMTMNQNLVERLRKAGYKITPPRLAVLEVIQQEGEHLNPQEILDHAKSIHPGLGRATVYRTLELLTQLGIVRPIYVGETGPTYIRAEGGHHHLVCSQCGAIFDFDQCMADEIAVDLASRFSFQIQSHLLEFYGLCAICQAEPAPLPPDQG
jgi:Fur family transcriptional regulator, ferric uptake regulator